jgi:hypothetical protein
MFDNVVKKFVSNGMPEKIEFYDLKRRNRDPYTTSTKTIHNRF